MNVMQTHHYWKLVHCIGTSSLYSYDSSENPKDFDFIGNFYYGTPTRPPVQYTYTCYTADAHYYMI